MPQQMHMLAPAEVRENPTGSLDLTDAGFVCHIESFRVQTVLCYRKWVRVRFLYGVTILDIGAEDYDKDTVHRGVTMSYVLSNSR